MQKHAATCSFVTKNYNLETGSMTGILEYLEWTTLQKRKKENRLILLYKGLKGKARIPTDDLILKTGVAEINTQWPFRYPLLVKTRIKIAYFLKLSVIRNGLKQIFRCALALLKFVFKNENVLGVSLEPCQIS